MPKRAHGAVVVVDEGKLVGVVTEADCTGVDRYTQVGDVLSADLLVLDADDLAAEGGLRRAFDVLHDARRRFAPVVRGGQLQRRAHPHRGACARRSTSRRWTPTAGCGSPPRSASTATCAAKAEALLAAGVDTLVVDTAHGHQEKMLAVLPLVRAAVDAPRHAHGHPGRRSSPATS